MKKLIVFILICMFVASCSIEKDYETKGEKIVKCVQTFKNMDWKYSNTETTLSIVDKCIEVYKDSIIEPPTKKK